jgi:hypothetical protein
VLKRISLIAVLAGAALTSPAAFCQQATAVQPAPPSTPVDQLDSVVVTGKVSGPGMWHVYKDDTHDLWILGTVKPLPAHIEWDSAMVRDMVKQAQDVLWYPGYSVNVHANLFQQAMLGFGYWRAQNNPDGKSLKDVLDPQLYARWQAAKAAYLPGNGSLENKRPLVAAEELLEAAEKRAGLSSKYSFYQAMKPTMDAAGVHSNYPQFKVDVSNATAKAALTDIRGMSLDDARCLAATLDAIDSDIPRMVANANAWARGDVAHISYALLARRDALCADSMMTPEFSAKYGLPNIEKSVADLWIKEAQSALARNAVTVAFVPMEYLTSTDSLMARLRALGYTVSAP